MKIIVLVIIFSSKMSYLFSQCQFPVTHTSGSKIINGINVTVTSTGFVDTNSVYCFNTKPYFIGFTWSSGKAQNGAYNFQFDPPVKSVSLNFGGISRTNSHIEIIKLYSNGSHYPIPDKGKLNGCDSMADLTSDGNIIGCNNCYVSGWKETIINGNISSISVFDSVVIGNPAGAIFSFFVCDKSLSEINNLKENFDVIVSPNPFIDKITISAKLKDEYQFRLYNIYGSRLSEIKFNEKLVVETDLLPEGLYLY